MSMNLNEQPDPLTERTKPMSKVEVAAQPSLTAPAPDSPRFSPQSSNGLEQSVELHIEELVLDGFEPAQRYTIGDALERELTRLFSEQRAPIAATQDVEIAHLNGGVINPKAGANAEATGIQLARAIYGGLIK